MRGIIINVITIVIYYILITTAINYILMGMAVPKFSRKKYREEYIITRKNRIDIQHKVECSAFSCAYVLRHFGIDMCGDEIYNMIEDKTVSGDVYPRDVIKLLYNCGFKARYRMGNINSLKREVNRGNPVIVIIRTYKDKNYLHYVPVVGYDEKRIFIAESLENLINNKNNIHYNREIEISEFKKLWNTSMIKMPLYRNTFITVEEHAKFVFKEIEE